MSTYTSLIQTSDLGKVLPNGDFTLPEETKIISGKDFIREGFMFHILRRGPRFDRREESIVKGANFTFGDLKSEKMRSSTLENDDILLPCEMMEVFDVENVLFSDDIRIIKFVDLLLSTLKFTDGINECLFGGFVRDLIYGDKAFDLDFQFTKPCYLMEFLKKLCDKFEVYVYSDKYFLNYFKTGDVHGINMFLVKIFVDIDGFYYPIDLISIRDQRPDDKFMYDFSVNMYGLMLRKRKNIPNFFLNSRYKYIFNDPFEYFEVIDAIHAKEKKGFEDFRKPCGQWGEGVYNSFERVYEYFYTPSLSLIINRTPMKFLISHNVKKENDFMMKRYQKLLDKGFSPLHLNTCNSKYCKCLMS